MAGKKENKTEFNHRVTENERRGNLEGVGEWLMR